MEPFVEQAIRTAIADLEALGAKAVPVSIPDLDGVLDCMLAITMSEAATYHQQTMRATPELFSDETRQLLETGELTLATTYINAQRSRLAIKNAFKQAIRGVDVLVTPTQPTTALKIGQTTSRIGAREEFCIRSFSEVLRSLQHFRASRDIGAVRLLTRRDAYRSSDYRQAVRRGDCT